MKLFRIVNDIFHHSRAFDSIQAFPFLAIILAGFIMLILFTCLFVYVMYFCSNMCSFKVDATQCKQGGSLEQKPLFHLNK